MKQKAKEGFAHSIYCITILLHTRKRRQQQQQQIAYRKKKWRCFFERGWEDAMLAREARKESKNEKRREADMNLVIVYVFVVIDHFMMSTVVSLVLSNPLLYVRQDKTIDRVNSVNQSSPWTQAHHPTFAPRAPSVPHALQTQNPAAPQKRARSCSQDRTHPSLAPVSKADRSEPVTQQNTLLPCTSPVAVDDRGHSYAVPVLFISGDLGWEVACGGRGWRGDAPDQNLF